MSPPNDKPKKREYVRLLFEFIFGFKNKRGEILDSWLYSAEEFNLNPQEFYRRVEEHIGGQRIPSLKISREEFAEGGPLSGQRQYLRLMRERFAIDTCAAPFGKYFFFSCRFVHIPALVRLWHIAATGASLILVYYLLAKPLGGEFALIAVISLVFAVAGVMRNASAFTDLDGLLLKIPVVATVYEDWFRMETYYRVDTRSLYKSILPELIKKLAAEMCAEKGIKLVRRNESPPVFTELKRGIEHEE